MTAKVPNTRVSLLSNTSAMSCASWSLPAGPSVCAGFSLRPDSPCTGCYAAQGRYGMRNVQDAQAARLEWWNRSDDSTVIETMVSAIARACKRRPYFRVFDSGDFTLPRDVARWQAIAARLPNVRFWIPTMVWNARYQRDAFRACLLDLAQLPNVCIRVSAGGATDCPLPTSSVADSGIGCPKQSAGDCESAGCRACWDKSVPSITYRRHGARVNWRKRLAR